MTTAHPAARTHPAASVRARALRLVVNMPRQAPVGLWSYGSLTIRSKARHGSVDLWLGQGKGPDSTSRVQRYDAATHRWQDEGGPGEPGDGTFPLPTSSDQPETVPLRIMPHDGDANITFTATYDDGRGHTYPSPDRLIATVAPTVAPAGLAAGGTNLVPGGKPVTFTLRVRNRTPYDYPGVRLRYDAGAWNSRSEADIAYQCLHIQQYADGRWMDVGLIPADRQHGFTAFFAPRGGMDIGPSTTANYRLRIWADRGLSRRATNVNGTFFASGPANSWGGQCEGAFTISRQ
ncbi:hypothetical protein ACWGCW_40230 [Streptomyces sp. NPDC054933]